MLELDKVRSCSSSLLSAALPFTSCLLRPSSSLSESARGPAPTKFLRDEKNAPPRVRNLLHEPNLPSFRLPKCILVIECAGACECKCVEQKAVGAKEPIESDKLQHSSRAAVRALSKTMGVWDERERERADDTREDTRFWYPTPISDYSESGATGVATHEQVKSHSTLAQRKVPEPGQTNMYRHIPAVPANHCPVSPCIS